jgi:hypothetical protein
MTVGERAELERLRLIGAQIAHLAARIDRAIFAGAWMDQRAGGVLNIALVRQPSVAALTDLTDSLPLRSKMVFRNAATPLVRLNDLQEMITKDWSEWKNKGIALVGSEVDEKNDVTIVRVASDVNQARRKMVAAYGTDGLAFASSKRNAKLLSAPADAAPRFIAIPFFGLQVAGTRNSVSGPVYGGTWISSANPGNGTQPCTASYANAQTNRGTELITAGHCGQSNATWHQGFDKTGPVLGAGGRNGFYNGQTTTNCDCQSIGSLPAGKSTNKILVDRNEQYAYTRLALPGDYYVGRPVCYSGAREYEQYGHMTCGQIMSSRALCKTLPEKVESDRGAE